MLLKKRLKSVVANNQYNWEILLDILLQFLLQDVKATKTYDHIQASLWQTKNSDFLKLKNDSGCLSELTQTYLAINNPLYIQTKKTQRSYILEKQIKYRKWTFYTT